MKYASPDNREVEKALVRLGAVKLSTDVMEDVYYARDDADFKETDEALRLRRRNGAAELTYKGPRMPSSSVKAREELSVSLDDPLSAARILERLGFRELLSVRKKRTTYRLDMLRVDVDEVEGLGQFVELEMITEAVNRAEEMLVAARKGLPLGAEVRETYLEMLLSERQ